MLGLIFFVLIYLNQSLQDCLIDNRNVQNAFEHQLLTEIKSKPELLDVPCAPGGLEVGVRFTLKWFKYDSYNGVFYIYSWVFLRWTQHGVSWNPADYGQLNETVISGEYMWYPRLKLFNGVGSEDPTHYFFDPCVVQSYGKVLCVYRVTDTVTCASDLTHWPYDSQSCSVKFGVWQDKNTTVRLRSTGRAITMIGADYGVEWDIVDYKQEEDQSAEVQLKMTFVLERHAEPLAAMLIYPSVALTILSIASFTLDVRRMIRIGLTCFNMANHFTFFMEIQEHIPGHSFYPPTILLYYRGSMLMNMLIILLSFILGVMCKTKKTPPVWIGKVNDIIFKGRGKFVIWPRWNPDVNDSEFAVQWINFANVINNICFVITVIVYVCLYCVYMPQPPPINY